MPFSIALSTLLIACSWMDHQCASSRPSLIRAALSRSLTRSDPPLHKPRIRLLTNRQKAHADDRAGQTPGRPGGSTGTPRAPRRVSHEGTPRRARVPPVDYRDGLAPCHRPLTQAQPHEPMMPSTGATVRNIGTLSAIIGTVSAIDRNAVRDRSESLSAIVGIRNQQDLLLSFDQWRLVVR